MKVYIVWLENLYSENIFNGVFSSRELAEEKISRYSKYDQSSMRIEEEFLDNF